MKKLRDKLREKFISQRGESISETLVALLISSLALVMLAGAISAAAGIVTKTREKLRGENGYYVQSEALVNVSSGESGNIVISNATNASYNQLVKYKVNNAFSDSPVVAYKKQ